MAQALSSARLSRLVAFKVTPEQLRELDLVARAQGTNRSEVIRSGLRREAEAVAAGEGNGQSGG